MHVWLFSTYQYSFFFFTYSATKWPVAAPFFARSQTDPVHRCADLGEIISFLSRIISHFSNLAQTTLEGLRSPSRGEWKLWVNGTVLFG